MSECAIVVAVLCISLIIFLSSSITSLREIKQMSGQMEPQHIMRMCVRCYKMGAYMSSYVYVNVCGSVEV